MQPTLEHCRSCAAPLGNPNFVGTTAHYCKYCVDANGAVKPHEAVLDEVRRAGVRQWMMNAWTLADDDALTRRADAYINTMPHWGA